MNKVFLKPGEIYFDFNESEVTTILGSCVSVCLFDTKLKVGAINHVVLPHNQISSNAVNLDNMQFADLATIEILKLMKGYGSKKENLVVKIIGGASSFNLAYESQDANVGARNIAAVKEVLSKFKLEITSLSCGGSFGRKLKFNTRTGEIQYKTFKEKNTNVLEQIKVLIVDDSKTIRQILRKIIEKGKKFEVIGEAENPYEAMEICKVNKPDVMTLDLNMPKMNGVTYLKYFMQNDPIATIVITDYSLKTCGPVFDALESGAVDYIKKPAIRDLEVEGINIRSKIQMASQANIESILPPAFNFQKPKMIKNSKCSHTNSLVLLGASTGGTTALTKLLLTFPVKIPPVLIVQHIPVEFSGAFARRLDEQLPFKVKEAVDGDILENDTVYIARGGIHMEVKQRNEKKYIHFNNSDPVNQFKPSVDVLFRSASRLSNTTIVSALLTGMGRDGASGLLELKNNGSFTIAQSEESCVVYGMPKIAVELGAAHEILHLNEIGSKLFLNLDKKRVRLVTI